MNFNETNWYYLKYVAVFYKKLHNWDVSVGYLDRSDSSGIKIVKEPFYRNTDASRTTTSINYIDVVKVLNLDPMGGHFGAIFYDLNKKPRVYKICDVIEYHGSFFRINHFMKYIGKTIGRSDVYRYTNFEDCDTLEGSGICGCLAPKDEVNYVSVVGWDSSMILEHTKEHEYIIGKLLYL